MAIWGSTDFSAWTMGPLTDTVLYFGLDAFPKDGTLDSVQVYFHLDDSADDWRFALYEGVSAGTPANATLVADLGLEAGPAGSDWVIATGNGETLTATKEYWIGCKSIQSSGGMIVRYGPDKTENSLHKLYNVSNESHDENDSWDATVPSPSNELLRSAAAYINYTAAIPPGELVTHYFNDIS